MSLAKSFTAAGVAESWLQVPDGQSFSYAVSGTFVGTVVLEQFYRGGWSVLATFTDAESGTLIADGKGEIARVRFRCTAFTSGTIVTSLANASTEVSRSFQDVNGADVLQITEAGPVVPAGKALAAAMDFSGFAPAGHVINFTGITLAPTSNLIRGTSVAPTRTSGWISLTGTVTTTPAQVYTDYRELHTAGVAEVLGFGAFPFMDSGASCASMFAIQAICEVDAGATVLTAGGAPAVGIFPLFAKCLLNGETFNSGAVAAAAFFSVQANVTDVSAGNVSVFNIENASGPIKDIFYLKATAGSWRNFFTFADEQAPVLAWGADNDPKDSSPDKGLRCMVGAVEYWIPLYVNS